MSAHHLTIAKASLTAGLLRPDITKVGRNDLNAFHLLLDKALTRCTSHNIQKCKEWMVENIAASAARTAALGKYLSSYSRHAPQEPSTEPKSSPTSRKILHILYIIHDVIHHAKYHTSDRTALSTFTLALQPYIIELVQLAASEQRSRVLARIHSLLEVWEDEKFYAATYVNKLREALAGTSDLERDVDDNEIANQQLSATSAGTTFTLPTTHGDPATPYYDLPAGNLLPFLEPGSYGPIRPDQVVPLRFTSGPADKPLINALKDFLKDVESIEHRYNIGDENIGASEIDELGQITTKDEAGHIIGDTYYGWSRAFCTTMKRRNQRTGDDEDRRHSLSQESSRSVSQSPRKRRRYSDSERSRSPSPSRSPPRLRAASPVPAGKEQNRWQLSQEVRSFAPGTQLRPPPAPPIHQLPKNPALLQAPPLGMNGLPIPPPRPPNWNGPWPPLPPPPGIGIMPYLPSNPGRGHHFLPPHPPPPPPGYPGARDYGGSYR